MAEPTYEELVEAVLRYSELYRKPVKTPREALQWAKDVEESGQRMLELASRIGEKRQKEVFS